jgi:opacity protein-like surface antigen
MKTLFAAVFLLSLMAAAANAQANGAFPPALANAKTIAIIDDTHTSGVSEGATDALRAWGRFTVVDDPDAADLTLRFDKSKDHTGQDSQKPADDGSTSYGYSMSFSTSVHMKAYLKDGTDPFYTDKTDDSKKKAGISCVRDFRTAFIAAHMR